jgi:putative photosynthetic complex assembly protein 2
MAYALPILATLFLWWASTGAILYLDNLNRRTFSASMMAMTALLLAALCGLIATSGETNERAAYEAFACGLVLWGWQIVSYYTGHITGPRKTALESGVRGMRRFVEAVRTSLHHEIAIVGFAVFIVAMTRGQPNQFGVWTFFVLWWMHTSAKLNLFFGVPNLGEELLPEHMRYLATFMTRKPMNLFFPLSVSVSTIVTTLLAQRALATEATPFEAAGFAILATLMALAVAEHWFLVAPLRANALWEWTLRREEKSEQTSEIRQSPLDNNSARQLPASNLEAA